MIWRSILSPVTKRHIERQILDTHPLHLFRIIQDVDQYSSFLPLCSYSKVLRYMTHPSESVQRFEATLTVGIPPLLQETYTSAVTVAREQLTVETVSVSSQLFDSLNSRWKLSYLTVENNNHSTVAAVRADDDTLEKHAAVATKCAVEFEVEMTVSDPLIMGTLDKLLAQVAGQQVNAFATRCQQIPMSLDVMTNHKTAAAVTNATTSTTTFFRQQ